MSKHRFRNRIEIKPASFDARPSVRLSFRDGVALASASLFTFVFVLTLAH